MSYAPRPESHDLTLGPEPASPIEPPPRARLSGLFEVLMERRPLAPPGLPRGVPSLKFPPDKSPSLLLVGDGLGEPFLGRVKRRGFRSVANVKDLTDALGALSERRYDAIAIWDSVHERPVHFVRSLLGFSGPSHDPLLPLLATRVKGVPIAVIHGGGGYAVFKSGASWCLSEAGGPDWVEALMALVPGRPAEPY